MDIEEISKAAEERLKSAEEIAAEEILNLRIYDFRYRKALLNEKSKKELFEKNHLTDMQEKIKEISDKYADIFDTPEKDYLNSLIEYYNSRGEFDSQVNSERKRLSENQ